MADGHGHDMGGMMMGGHMNNGTTPTRRHHMMMHMSFYWGKNAEILFSGWPGFSGGMYFLSLLLVFLLAILVEWLSHSRIIKPDTNDRVAGALRTLLHALRMGLAYLVMLAVMSFNGGVFIVVIAGHAVGFFVFGSGAFGSGGPKYSERAPDLPPMSC